MTGGEVRFPDGTIVRGAGLTERLSDEDDVVA